MQAEPTAIPLLYPQVMAYLTSRRLQSPKSTKARVLINVANFETEMILTLASRRGSRSDSCSTKWEIKFSC